MILHEEMVVGHGCAFYESDIFKIESKCSYGARLRSKWAFGILTSL